MEAAATVFVMLLTMLSVWLAHRWLIKADKEEKRQKTYRAVEKLHSDH